jgi:hypothetical protein
VADWRFSVGVETLGGDMLKHGFVCVVLVAASAAAASAQDCLHGRSENQDKATRRRQALQVAQQINLAQVVAVGPRRETPRFRPLEELPNILPAPRGFRIQFHTDGESYTFSLKDTLDPCAYAIFSDQDKRIYEATPTSRSLVVPATRN